MLPQTDAEITAYNEGVRIARTPSARSHYSATRSLVLIGDMSDAAQRALDALGPDLFWTWADRGYYSHQLTTY